MFSVLLPVSLPLFCRRFCRAAALLLSMLFVLSCVMVSAPKTARADESAATAIVTANRLNLRKGPSTDRSIVAVLQKGVLLDVLGVSGDWLHVQLPSGDPAGYVLAEHVAMQNPGYAALGIGVTTGNVRLRRGSGTSHPSLGTIPRGTMLIVLEKATSSWYRVRRADTGKEGYASASYVSIVCKCASGSGITAPTGTPASVKGSGVNLRSGPSTDYSSLGKLSSGTALTVLSQNNGWYRVYVRTSGTYGYIYQQYVRFAAIPDELAVSGWVSGSGVNLRTGPSTTYQSLAKLAKNTALTVLETAGDWYRVRIKSSGKEGYIYQKYVTVQ